MNAKPNIEELVKKYAANIKRYESPAYNETELRVDFLNPLFEILGWDVNNAAGLPAYSREVRHEANVYVEENDGMRSKKPDYLFKVGSKKCFFLEAKKPSIDITTKRSAAFQIRRYGWSGNLEISVLSNFKDTVIYDCSVRPLSDDIPNVARIAHFHYTEYAERWDELSSWLSKSAITDGSFEARTSVISSDYRHEPFDEFFLEKIRKWRILLSSDLLEQHIHISDEELNSYVQRILNRILFLRICEDKELERYEELKNVQTDSELLGIFEAADQKYNSGLFEMISAHEPMPSSQVLLSVLKDLYYPNSSYDFNVIDSFVMSQIYDLFLCEKVESDNEEISIVATPDLAEMEGAVCTPRQISDLIANKVIDRLISENEQRDPLDMRVADICCGSGVFLISAYERLCDERLSYLERDLETSLRNGAIVPTGNSLKLSFSERRALLAEAIFGIDIDPAAVEICRFNLFVKLLEDASRDEIEDYCTMTNRPILPNLDKNIIVGNSLIDEGFYDFIPDGLSDADLIQKVKPLNLNDVFDDKFDAIIGNPPYVRVQNLVQHNPEEYQYVKSDFSPYETAKEGLPDKYQLFLERSLSLVEHDGYLGFIVPNKFMTLQGGKALRKILSKDKLVREIIDFGSNQVFPNRMTYTCILILGKESAEEYELTSVDDLKTFYLKGADSYSYSTASLSETAWSNPDPKADRLIGKLRKKVRPLKDFAKIFVGLQTSADDVYVLTPVEERSGIVNFIDKDGKKQSIEKEILREFIHKVSINKYEPIRANKYLIFPYKIIDGKAMLIPLLELREKYPLAYSYLRANQEALMQRKCSPALTDDTWYRYGRSQSLTRFEPHAEHIVWSTLSQEAKYTIDNGSICFTGGGNGPYYGMELREDTDLSLLYILSLINHPFLESFIKRKSSYFAGGYYSHGKQFVEELPIFNIDFENDMEVEIHNEIVSCATNLIILGMEKNNALSPDQVAVIDRAMRANEHKIQRTIDILYGITNEGQE